MLFIASKIGLKSLGRHIKAVTNNGCYLPHLEHVVLLSEQAKSRPDGPKICGYSAFSYFGQGVSDATLNKAQDQVKNADILNLQFTSGKN